MSSRNGDKAKFHRQRKHKIEMRRRIRELVTGLKAKDGGSNVTAKIKAQSR